MQVQTLLLCLTTAGSSCMGGLLLRQMQTLLLCWLSSGS
jgi:hypothetical protein